MAKKTELEIAQEELTKAEDNLKSARAKFQEAHNKSLAEKPQMTNHEIRMMMDKIGVKSQAEETQAALAKLQGAKL
ncbi:coil containing protein [Vibrio phage 1.197.A._10N.286.54.F2]|nr:coil containing protein [Vibrio phage 1.197.A._10N.286.54.F2]